MKLKPYWIYELFSFRSGIVLLFGTWEGANAMPPKGKAESRAWNLGIRTPLSHSVATTNSYKIPGSSTKGNKEREWKKVFPFFSPSRPCQWQISFPVLLLRLFSDLFEAKVSPLRNEKWVEAPTSEFCRPCERENFRRLLVCVHLEKLFQCSLPRNVPLPVLDEG